MDDASFLDDKQQQEQEGVRRRAIQEIEEVEDINA